MMCSNTTNCEFGEDHHKSTRHFYLFWRLNVSLAPILAGTCAWHVSSSFGFLFKK
jgi:hypothetical protein